MADIGLNQNLEIASRHFHVQTVTSVDEGTIRSEIFEKGRLLYVESYKFDRRGRDDEEGVEKRLRHLVDQFHQSILNEIDSLFEISEKVLKEDEVAPHEKLGLVSLYMHIFDKAEIHFKKAIEINPEKHSTYIYLARCYFLQKRIKLAYKTLAPLTSRSVLYPDLLNLLGLIMMEERKYIQSMKYFKEALKQNPKYTEVYMNLAEALLRRIILLRGKNKDSEVNTAIRFLKAVFKKITEVGNDDEKKMIVKLKSALNASGINKALSLLNEFRDTYYIRRIPPQVIGYEFFLRLRYLPEEMPIEVLNSYEYKISEELKRAPQYPDLWNYLALIHLMQCRHQFLKGLDDFRKATQINPNFEKANKNLRLVENDGREFLSLINAIV
ncbi:MAG: tetratricopeptide repeat protein [Calditrichia bacterium]